MQDNKVLIEFRRQKKAGRTISKIELVDLKNIGWHTIFLSKTLIPTKLQLYLW